MRRNLISFGWDGSVYNCAFNQMLNLPVRDRGGNPLDIASLSLDDVFNRRITVSNHHCCVHRRRW